jgi:hypothetical protein
MNAIAEVWCSDCDQPATVSGRCATHNERDLAVIARIGGSLFRVWRNEGGLNMRAPLALRHHAEFAAFRKAPAFGSVPEAAFDWPIYRAALAVRATSPEGGIEQYQSESR